MEPRQRPWNTLKRCTTVAYALGVAKPKDLNKNIRVLMNHAILLNVGAFNDVIYKRVLLLWW